MSAGRRWGGFEGRPGQTQTASSSQQGQQQREWAAAPQQQRLTLPVTHLHLLNEGSHRVGKRHMHARRSGNVQLAALPQACCAREVGLLRGGAGQVEGRCLNRVL